MRKEENSMPGPMGGPGRGSVTEKSKNFKKTTKKLIILFS